MLFAVAICFSAAAIAQTTHKEVKHRTGMVVGKYDGKVDVVMDDGTVKEFTPAPGKKIMVDGKETGYDDLKVGTVLAADFVSTTTFVPVRTEQIENATVKSVVGNTVIVNNGKEFKSHTVPAGFKFLVNGKEVGVNDLRPGMKVTATIVSTETKVVSEKEIANVGGKGPAEPAPAPVAAPAPAPAPVVEPAPAPAPAVVAEKKMPKTASPVPFAGLAGALSLLAGLGLGSFRRSR
jgi:hypothetical protein